MSRPADPVAAPESMAAFFDRTKWNKRRSLKRLGHHYWTFRSERIKGANGVWYRLECRCAVCRGRDGTLCENILTFIRSKPAYVHFVLVRYDD